MISKKKAHYIKSLFFLGLLLFSTQGFACEETPEEQKTDTAQLLYRSKNIVLATVVKAEILNAESLNVIYEFKVEKIIIGSADSIFTLEGGRALDKNDLNDFEGHKNLNFWNAPTGRTVSYIDCQIHPAFSVGATYLLFLDKPYHNKSFEQIKAISGVNKDKWLQYVEDFVKKNKATEKKLPS